MIFISVFMVTIKQEIQAICVLGVAFISYVIHTDYNPFVDSDLNDAEKRALISATFTIYTGLYYLAGLGDWASFSLYVLIVLVNCFFGVAWLRGFLREQIATFGKSAMGQKLFKKMPFLEKWSHNDPKIHVSHQNVKTTSPTKPQVINIEIIFHLLYSYIYQFSRLQRRRKF
jgi:hypothetical protein